MGDLTDAQFAAYVDRILECRKAEDTAKEDTKQAYADLKDAGGDKTEAGLLVRALRMDEKDAGKAQAREEMLEDARMRYRRGKASHVRAREASQSYAEAKGGDPATPEASNSKASNAEDSETPATLTDTQEQPEEPATQSVPACPRSNSSLAAREADESAAPLSPSAAPPADTVAEPQAPQAGAVPHSNPQPAASLGADTAGDVPPPSSPASSFNNPRCQHPGTCSHAHDQGSCDDCFFDWAKRPLEEQRRLWADAMEAASETEAAA